MRVDSPRQRSHSNGHPPVRAVRRGPRASYPSLAAFYNAERRRLSSGELDVGLWWRGGPEEPLHRAAWIVETGELYLARLGPSSRGGGRVEVLAQIQTRDQLERVLNGWRERCGQTGSLGWLREQARTSLRPVAWGHGLPEPDPIAA
jgi:hypothetical protein